MSAALTALLTAYPAELTPDDGAAWLSRRRALLAARAAPTGFAAAASSGCAAHGARTHALTLAEDAAHALARLEAGQGTCCEVCGARLPFERVDAAPTAVRCTGCARPDTFDTRWCR